MIFQQWNSMIGREYPIVERGLRTGGAGSPGLRQRLIAVGLRIEERSRRSIQQLLRPQLFEFFLYSSQSAISGKFSCAELAGGKVQRGKADTVPVLCKRCQKIVFFRSE